MDGSRTRAGVERASVTKAPVGQKSINLALQGGGAHGAFTWGVLDRLAEDERIMVDGISATSAGAMNAVVFTYGWSEGGRNGARQALTNFWRRISHAAAMGPLQPSWFDKVTGNHSLSFSPAFMAVDIISRLFSPYEFNPLNNNPLRDVLIASVDFEALSKADCPVKLFLSATNVRTGKVKVFERNPLVREKLPRTATEIMNRINEISFNSSLMREMRAISFVTKLIQDNKVNGDGLRHLLIHSISAEDEMNKLGVASKLNGDWGFLTHLRDIGREYADAWLISNFDRLGKESTIDIGKQYL